MPAVTLANGTIFDAPSGSTILDAALQHDLILEYSCRTGRCSTCRAKCISGEVKAIRPVTALSPEDAAAGWILTCAYEAVSDIELDVANLQVEGLHKPRICPARISRLELLGHDVLKVQLRLPPRSNFAFLPGQYVDVIHSSGLKRSYSISSGADNTDLIEMQIRRYDGGQLSRYWFEEAKVNDLLRFNGPKGTFFLRDDAGVDLVFLATGTGIAPVCSMLMQLAKETERPRPRSVSLYWGGRQSSDLYLNPSIMNAALHYIPVLSRASADWGGKRGYVQDALLRDLELGRLTSLANMSVYACGSETMIENAADLLSRAGLPRQSFFSDAFVSTY